MLEYTYRFPYLQPIFEICNYNIAGLMDSINVRFLLKTMEVTQRC